MSSQDSDSEYQEFVTNFYDLVQDINEFYAAKSKESRTAKFLKQAKARRSIKISAPQYRNKSNHLSNARESRSKCFRNHLLQQKLSREISQTYETSNENLENSQVEPYIFNVHLILRDLKLKQQILRNAQKQVYLNLIEYNKQKTKKSKPRNCCLHIYLAEKIYQEKLKEAATCKKFQEGPKIVIPLLKNPEQTRKGSME